MVLRKELRIHDLASQDRAPRRAHVATVPGTLAPLLPLDLPEGLRGQARERVAERQVKDMLGSDVALDIRPVHLAGTGGKVWNKALVTQTDLVAAWRGSAGSACSAVIPDFLALPTAESVWTVAQRGDCVLVRLGPGDGFSAKDDVARVLLARALADAADRQPKVVYIPGSAPDWARDLFEAESIVIAATEGEVAKAGATRPVVLKHGESALDLRNDPSAERARLRRQVLPMRWPVLAAMLLAGIWATTQVVAIQGLDSAIAEEQRAALELTRESFVPSGPILDVRAQVSSVLTELRTRAAEARSQVSPLVAISDAADTVYAADAKPEQVLFDVQNGLSIVLEVQDFAALDSLAASFANAGLNAEVVSAGVDDSGQGVRAEVRIAAGTQEEQQ